MGFWSTVGKIAPIASFAIPGVGPALGLGLKAATGLGAAAGAIGGVANALGKGRTQGRALDAAANTDYDRTRLEAARLLDDALRARAELDLRQRQFALEAPGRRASNAVRGDTIAHVQDANIVGPIVRTGGRIPQITGGLRPSLISDGTRQLGSQMSRQALLDQMQGDTFQPMAPPNIPTPTPLPQPGKLDKILNGVGLVGGVLGAFGAEDDDDSLLKKYGMRPRANIPQIRGVPNLPYIPLPRVSFPEEPQGGF